MYGEEVVRQCSISRDSAAGRSSVQSVTTGKTNIIMNCAESALESGGGRNRSEVEAWTRQR